MHAPAPEPIPVELLLMAYRSGIFPMADSREDTEVFWVEPRERAIIPLETFRPSKSLRKVLRQDRYRVTCNTAFTDVVQACAAPREDDAKDGGGGSWISRRIETSYRGLHAAGHAHSIECWRGSPDGEELVGGLYGVSFDRVFCGESMFSRADNASKVALAWLVAAMRHAGFQLLDCQFMTDHLATLGAQALPQADYVALLEQARGEPLYSLPDSLVSLVGAAAVGAAAGSAADDASAASPGKRIAQSFTQTS